MFRIPGAKRSTCTNVRSIGHGRTVVMPLEVESYRHFVLGQVVQRWQGVFPIRAARFRADAGVSAAWC